MSQLIDISILKNNRNFRLTYLGQFISLIGTMITSVALPFQVYAITKSTLMVGMLSLAQLSPLIITALLGGVLADRCNRRVILLICEIFLILCCGGLIYLAHVGSFSIAPLFVLATMMSAITGLHRPAFDSILQQFLTKNEYKSAAALRGFAVSFCMIVGPAIAGLIIYRFGLVVTYLVDFFTFFISIICIILLNKIPQLPKAQNESIIASLKQGLLFAFKREELIGSYVVDIVAMFFAIPNALFPAMAETYWDTTALGMLYSAPAAGALIISFFSGWTSNIKREGKAIALSAAACGVAIIGFGFSKSLYLALFFLSLYGAFDTISGIFRSSLWNSTIPHNYRGRLAGIEMISYISGPKLGDFRAGMIASTIGIPAAIITGGGFCVIGVGICCVILPKFWRYSE